MSKILRTLVLGSSLALARPGIAQDPDGWHFTKFDFPARSALMATALVPPAR